MRKDNLTGEQYQKIHRALEIKCDLILRQELGQKNGLNRDSKERMYGYGKTGKNEPDSMAAAIVHFLRSRNFNFSQFRNNTFNGRNLADWQKESLDGAKIKFARGYRTAFQQFLEIEDLQQIPANAADNLKIRVEEINNAHDDEKEFDLFVTAPIFGLNRQKQIIELLTEKISGKLKNLYGTSSPAPTGWENLESEIKAIIHQSLLGEEEKPTNTTSFFRQCVIQTIDALQRKYQLNNVYYSRFPGDLKDSIYARTPQQVLEDEFPKIRRSRALLLICPYNSLFSTCWLQVAYAMALPNMQVYIVYHADENLLFGLREAIVLKNVHMSKVNSLEELPEIVAKWLEHDKWFSQTFFKMKTVN